MRTTCQHLRRDALHDATARQDRAYQWAEVLVKGKRDQCVRTQRQRAMLAEAERQCAVEEKLKAQRDDAHQRAVERERADAARRERTLRDGGKLEGFLT